MKVQITAALLMIVFMSTSVYATSDQFFLDGWLQWLLTW